MLSRQHVNVNFLDLLLFVEVGDYSFRTKSNRFVGMNIPSSHRRLNFHSLVPFRLMSHGVPMRLLHPSLLLMIARAFQLGIALMVDSKNIFSQLISQTLIEWCVGTESFIEVEFESWLSGNIGSLLVETAVNEDIVLNHETGVSEAIDVWQFVPIRRISVIDIQRHRLADLVVPSPNYQQQCSHKQTFVLVPFRRF